MSQTPDSPSTSIPDLPDVFGSYEILRSASGTPEILGEGAFGRTYKALHRFLEIPVALKVIVNRSMSDPVIRERFLSEAKAVAKLAHPHIARIYDFGEVNGVLYCSIEYCGGGNLSQRVSRQGPLPAEEVLAIGQQIAAALQTAHKAGFIHRDLKPSNLMLMDDQRPGFAKLIDFGLVQAQATNSTDPADEATPENRFMGTPHFASPEQISGEPLDARSDLFSLGLTLWYLLEGRLPENGTFRAIATSRLNASSYEPLLPADLPQPLRQALARLLEKKPEQRTPSASELLADLDEAARALGLPVFSATEWSMAAEIRDTPTSDTLAKKQALISFEPINSPLASLYQIQSRKGSSPVGPYYLAQACPPRSGSVLLQSIQEALVANESTFLLFRERAALAAALPAERFIRPGSAKQFQDGHILEMDGGTGDDLDSLLRTPSPVKFSQAHPLLQTLAIASDEAQSAGLPGIDFSPSAIEVPPSIIAGLPEKVRTFPKLLSAEELQDALGETPADAGSAATLDSLSDAGSEDDPVGQFALLIYRIVAGRNCPFSATLSIQKYVAISGVSEHSNRLLAQAISGGERGERSCTAFLETLLEAEGNLSHTSLDRTLDRTVDRTVAPSLSQSRAPFIAPPSSSAPAVPQAELPTPPLSPAPAPASPAPTTSPGTAARGKAPLLIGIAASLLLLGGAAAFLVLKKSDLKSDLNGDSTASDDSSLSHSDQSEVASSPSGRLPGNTALSLTGKLPTGTEILIGDTPLTAETPSPNKLKLPLGSDAQPLPLKITFRAPGFAPFTLVINREADASESHPVALVRATGTLSFQKSGTSDYSHAVLKMLEVLPSEQGRVELERFTRGKEFRDEGNSDVDLPTGIYQVTLKGSNDRLIAPRKGDTVEIRDGQTVVINLPTSLAGHYKGSFTRNPGGVAVERELYLEPGLTSGWITESEAGGTSQKAPLASPRLDPSGKFTCTALFSRDYPRYDEALTLTPQPQPQEGSAFELEAVELPSDTPAIREHLQRAPHEDPAIKGPLSQAKP